MESFDVESFDITPLINNCDLNNHENPVYLPTKACYNFDPLSNSVDIQACEAFLADFFKRWPSYTYNTKPYTPPAKALPAYNRKLHPFKLSSVSKALDDLFNK